MAATGVTYKPSFENANNASSSTYFQRQQFGHKFALEPNVESLTTFSFTESPKTKVQKLSEPMKSFFDVRFRCAIRGRFTSEKKSQEQQREDVEKRSKTSGWRKYITNPIISPDQDRRVARQQSVEEEKSLSSENEEKVSKSKPMNFLQRARAVAMKQKRKRLRSKSSSSSNIESSSSSSSGTRSDEKTRCRLQKKQNRSFFFVKRKVSRTP